MESVGDGSRPSPGRLPPVRRLWHGIRTADARVALALVYTAAVLTAMEYWWLPGRVQARMEGLPRDLVGAISLEAGLTWSAACLVGYLTLLLNGRTPERTARSGGAVGQQ